MAKARKQYSLDIRSTRDATMFFPFAYFGGVDIDWAGVYVEWVKLNKYCKRHHLWRMPDD